MKSIRLHKMIPVKLLFVNNEARMLEQRDYEVEFSIHTEGEKGQTSGAVSQNKGFQKICYMLNEIINESIVYTPEQIELMEKYFCDYSSSWPCSGPFRLQSGRTRAYPLIRKRYLPWPG